MISAVAAVVWPLILGWAIVRRRPSGSGGTGPVAATVMWAIAGLGGWLLLLDLAGVRWSVGTLLPVPLVGTALLVTGRSPRPALAHVSGWTLGAGSAVAIRAALVAMDPAFGWDFRYIWGLRGRVLSLAGGIDWQWAQWPSHSHFHPDYPPLWPSLLAGGEILGSTVEAAASVWQALLVVALAAGCWALARPAPRPVRALAAVCGAWAPVIFRPFFSGYAEPLVAFLLVAVLAALRGAVRGEPGSLGTFATASASLVLVKNEGLVLGVAAAVALVLTCRRSRCWVAAIPPIVAALGWRIALTAHGLAGEGVVLAPATFFQRLSEVPRAAIAVATVPLVVIGVAWLLLLAVPVRNEEHRGIVIVLAVWAVAVASAYLTTPWDVSWHLATSIERVMAVALPAGIAAALGAAFIRPRDERPAPDSAPAG